MADESALVLVVDDNEMNRDMLSRRLKRQGYNIEVAEDGEVALEAMRSKTYDLVLLDVMMPRLNGYEVLEAVRQDTSIVGVPIIMISALDDLDSVVKCIELGAEDYLFKPFNPVLLKARVQATLEKSRSRQETSAVANLYTPLRVILQQVQDLNRDSLSDEQRAKVQQIYNGLENILKSLGS